MTGIGIIGCDSWLTTTPTRWPSTPACKWSPWPIATPPGLDASPITTATAAESPSALLADERIDLVVNLTNPRSHVEVTTAALEAGRHVYPEKPLAMDLTDAVQLVELAESKNLQLSAAPCSLFGESAQTVGRRYAAG